MPQSSPIVTRIALGTMIGVLIGLGGFVLVPVLVDAPDPMLRWGILFWYLSLGAVIGAVAGPIRAPLARLATAILIGGWLNTVLVFFAHRQMQRVMEAVFGSDSAITSPFWFVLEGAVVGALIGFAIERFGTERESVGLD